MDRTIDGLASMANLTLPNKGPPVHLELGQSLRWQRHGLVQEFADPEVDPQPGGARGRGLETEAGTSAGGCQHPAGLQL